MYIWETFFFTHKNKHNSNLGVGRASGESTQGFKITVNVLVYKLQGDFTFFKLFHNYKYATFFFANIRQ